MAAATWHCKREGEREREREAEEREKSYENVADRFQFQARCIQFTGSVQT